MAFGQNSWYGWAEVKIVDRLRWSLFCIRKFGVLVDTAPDCDWHTNGTSNHMSFKNKNKKFLFLFCNKKKKLHLFDPN